MASLGMHTTGKKAGAWYIRFLRNRERKIVYLGKVRERHARKVFDYVEDLVAAAISGQAIKQDTAAWLTTIESGLQQKLIDVELIGKPASKPEAVTLDSFIAGYMATRHDLKPSTRLNLQVVRRNLVTFFGADKPLAEITSGCADEFRRWLRRKSPAKQDEPTPPGLADNTARRTCGRAKQFFRAAVRKRLLTENPFADMADCQVQANKDRDFFVTRAAAQKVLDACPSTQWRLLFAMSRYGGLRCPSEHARLRWADIDWANNRFTVHSPKTELHEGKDKRAVPIFPELRPYLEAARAEAKPDAEFVFTIRTMRAPKPNPRTTMEKIVKAAGLTPWPKLFQNCRASRATEIASAFPAHVEAEWLGHDTDIAKKFYISVTEDDFTKATAKQPGEPQGEPQGSQNSNPPEAAEICRLLQIVQKALENSDPEQLEATVSRVAKQYQAPPVGLESTRDIFLLRC